MKNSNFITFILTGGGLWMALDTTNILMILGGVVVLIAFVFAVMNDVIDKKEIKEIKK
jgi:hypothetical protein